MLMYSFNEDIGFNGKMKSKQIHQATIYKFKVSLRLENYFKANFSAQNLIAKTINE